jgi:hypothetical protein
VEVQLHSFFTLLSIEVRSHPYSPAVLPRWKIPRPQSRFWY